MKKLILALLLTISPLVFAETPEYMIVVDEQTQEKLVLTPKPCDGKVAELLVRVQPGENKALYTNKGIPVEACWKATPGGVSILFEDGDQALVPFSAFKPAEDI